MMKVRFQYHSVQDDRVFNDVLTIETGTYEHGKEAIVKQKFEGTIDIIPVRGYDELIVTSQST